MALHVPSQYGSAYGSPQTPRLFADDALAAAPAGHSPSGGGSLFVATQSSALADAQLQRDARVESLQRRWAEVANAHADWVQDTLLLASERWPALDGVTRLDVTTVNDVVLYDVRTLAPYRAALEADDTRLRAKAARFAGQLAQLGDALAADGAALEESGNRFTFSTPARCSDAAAALEVALAARADAFADEAERVEAAHAAFLDFSAAAGEFAERLADTAAALAHSCSGQASPQAALAEASAAWGGGALLMALWARLGERDAACAARGVVGTRLAMARLASQPDVGYTAVRAQADAALDALRTEAALAADFSARAAALESWVASAAAQFGDAAAPLPATLPAAEAAWAALREFLAAERPARARDLAALIELRAAASAAWALHGRPGAPPLGFEALEASWAALEEGVSARAAALGGELRRQRALGDCVARFTADALELADWLRARRASLGAALAGPPRSKNAARGVKALVAGYAAEWAERHQDLAALRQRGCRIVAHRYERADKVAALFDKLAEGMAEASLDPGEQRLPPLVAARPEEADLRA